MTSQEEIMDFIRRKVSDFKAVNPDSIDVDARVIEDIGLAGDDFSEVDYLLREKYSVRTDNYGYHRGMSVRDWASTILGNIGGIQN